MKSERIVVDNIDVPPRHRQADPAKVASLAESMRALGLQQPISVHVTGDDEVQLVAGLHRLEAARKLGWEHIDAIVVDMDAIDRELWEIDENLCRAELTETEEAQHLKRRKELWGQRETESGQSLATLPRTGRGNTGFAAETAAVTGQAKSTINSKIARAEAIAPDVMEAITKTPHDKGVVLDTLKKLDHAEQRQALGQVQSGSSASFQAAYESIRGKPVSPKDAVNDYEAVTLQFNSLVSAWNRAGPEPRQQFIEYIDRPVFDRTRAA